MMISCPYCGNTFLITSFSNNMCYCSKCGRYFRVEPQLLSNSRTSNASTAAIENNIRIRLPDAANAARSFYYTDENINLLQSEYNKLTINAKDIIINDEDVSSLK